MTGRADDTAGYVLPPAEMPAVAAADTSTVQLGTVPYDAVITDVTIVPRTAITANGTNFGTISIQNAGPLDSGSTVVATRSWAATNSVAGTKEKATLGAAANLEVKAGDRLKAVHTTAGSGLAMPAFSVIVTYRAR